MIDLIKSNEFDFWLPLDINKSDTAKKTLGHTRWVQGISSTEDEDLQTEIVEQRGIDTEYFLQYGYYNNDHKPGFENKVGQPTEARITKEGLWTKGFLWEPGTHKVADAIWELANALAASGSTRKLGFSIQGKVIRRAGRRILKCWIQDIAITAAPINTHTWLDVVKSLNAVPADMWCVHDQSGLIMPETALGKSVACVCKKPCGACKKGIVEAPSNEGDLDLNKTEDEQKAFTTSSGAALVPESLDSKVRDQKWANKSLSFDECVDLLHRERGLSRTESIVLTEAVFEINRN